MATVFIGCKLPNGLIMEVCEPGPTPFQPKPIGTRVLLKGANAMREGIRENPLIGKYCITEVEASFAKKWEKRHAECDFMTNKAVFIADTRDEAEAMARELSRELTGLEALNPKKDERIPAGAKADPERLKALMDNSPAISRENAA